MSFSNIKFLITTRPIFTTLAHRFMSQNGYQVSIMDK